MGENIYEKNGLIITRYCGPNRTPMWQFNVGDNYECLNEKDVYAMVDAIISERLRVKQPSPEKVEVPPLNARQIKKALAMSLGLTALGVYLS